MHYVDFIMNYKNFISIIFLFLFLLSLPSIIIFLEIKKSEIKKEIKNKIISGINKNELVFLKFSKQEAVNQLKWEHSKEFKYNNEMYDVIEKKESNDSVYYWCWLDNEETKINKQLNNLLSIIWNDNALKTDLSKRFNDFFRSFYFENYAPIYFIQHCTPILLLYLEFDFYKSLKIEPPVPPPWF